MRTALIGYTGFLGGNLAAQTRFTHTYNSKNIHEIAGQQFDLVVCGGITATKWWANQNPQEDRARIVSLLAHLSTIEADQFVILSTVDVYPILDGVTEAYDCAAIGNHPYGTNRLYFERMAQKLFPNVTIIRIAGVFGPGLKKNVIFDLLNDNCLDAIQPESCFQYYDASRLWSDIQRVLAAGVPLVNLASEPVRTAELAAQLFPGKAIGTVASAPVHYDVRTEHAALFGKAIPYLTSATDIVTDIGHFIRNS